MCFVKGDKYITKIGGPLDLLTTDINKLPKDIMNELNQSPASQLEMFYLRQKIGELAKFLKEQQNSLKLHIKENEGSNKLIKNHTEEIKKTKELIETLEKTIGKNQTVKARNGDGLNKKDREMNKVVEELHDSIYWMRPIGTLITTLVVFVKKYPWWTSIIVSLIIIFNNQVGDIISLVKPGKIGNMIIEFFTNK